jgi:hypothetical protein
MNASADRAITPVFDWLRLRAFAHPCSLAYQFQRGLSRSAEKNFGFYDTAVRAFEVMNCKIAARRMSLHGGLPDWLATLRAGVVVE